MLLNSFELFFASFVAMVAAERIVPKIVTRIPTIKRNVTMLTLAVAVALMILGPINETFHKELSEQQFDMELGLLLAYFLYSSLQNRAEIQKKLQLSYYYSIGVFTYIFLATGIVIHWLLPFSLY